MSTSISLDVNYDLIQSIRLVHAVAESDAQVYVPPEEVGRFARLQAVFPLSFAPRPGVILAPPMFSIRHEEPLTSISGVSRALVFPHAILQWCRSRWPSRREVFVSFCGLLTQERRVVLKQWLDARASSAVPRLKLPEASLFAKVRRRLRPGMIERHSQTYSLPQGSLLLWSSNAGRRFPVKAWDEEYFAVLLKSQFVLCPNGDFVWTYRFFEAILCGAIPIVQDTCPAYSGFQYHTMRDSTYSWSVEAAEHNYRLCVERLAIPLELLNRELAGLTAPIIGGAGK